MYKVLDQQNGEQGIGKTLRRIIIKYNFQIQVIMVQKIFFHIFC